MHTRCKCGEHVCAGPQAAGSGGDHGLLLRPGRQAPQHGPPRDEVTLDMVILELDTFK